MTQEEQAIEDKFKQLYEQYEIWPHIPSKEQELFCKLLLDSNLVKKITLKAFVSFFIPLFKRGVDFIHIFAVKLESCREYYE